MLRLIPLPLQICGADTPYLSPDTLKKKHEAYMKAALDGFKSTRKMGGSAFSKQYEEELVRKMEEAYESYVKRNESKHILNAYRTPAVLCLVMVISYLISSILDTIGVDSLSDTAIFGLYIPLLLMGVWVYVRYSGNLREIGAMIDNITTTVWENVSGSHTHTHPPTHTHTHTSTHTHTNTHTHTHTHTHTDYSAIVCQTSTKGPPASSHHSNRQEEGLKLRLYCGVVC